MKPLQPRKKSSSFSANTQPTTINKTAKTNNLTSCRSVSAFVQTNRNNKSARDITKFSIGDNLNNRTTRRGMGNGREKLDMMNNNGVSYKQMIEKRKKQSARKNLSEEVLATVDVFHQTLHSLPLDKLILTQNPFYWLEEQAKTLVKLQEKFNKLYPSLRPQTARYYSSKLQSVQKVLKNIRENLQTLDKMTALKQYNSGATSRNSQSLSSLAASHKGMSFNGEMLNVNVNQSNQTVREQKRRKNKVKQGRKFITETQQANNEQQWGQLSQFNNWNKQNNINLNNTQQIQSKPVLVKPINHNGYTTKNTHSYNHPNNEITEKDNFQLQEDCSSSCSHLGNDSSLQKLHYQPKGCLINNCETVRSEEENRVKFVVNNGGVVICEEQGGKGDGRKPFKKGSMMTRTIQKYPIMAHSISEITNFLASNMPSMSVPQPQPTFTTSNLSKESLMTSTQPNQNFQFSTISLGSQTKRQSFLPKTQLSNQLAVLQNQAQKLRQQVQIKNRLIVGMQNKHERLTKALKEEFQKKEKQYLETIYELKSDNQDRQQAIRQLLLQKQEQLLDKQSQQQQSRSQQQKLITELQQLQAQLQKLTQQNTALVNKHTLLSQSLQSLTSQLHQFQVRQQQLRQTVHLQRQRTKKCQAQSQLLQQQLQDKSKQLQQKQTQVISLQQCIDQLNAKVKQFQAQSQRHNQKQSVYKLKYFRLYAEFDSFRQKVNDDNYYWQKICLSCKKQYTSPQQQPSNAQNQLQLRQLISFHKKRLLN